LSLVTTVPFLLLLIYWSTQDRQGAAHTIAGLIWATIAAIGLGVLSHRRLSVPIVQLATTAYRIGQGDFSVRAPFHRHDELGELAGAMDSMTASLQSLTAELRDARDRVVHTVTEVGRLASSGIDAEELWPLLADIAQRLISADGQRALSARQRRQLAARRRCRPDGLAGARRPGRPLSRRKLAGLGGNAYLDRSLHGRSHRGEPANPGRAGGVSQIGALSGGYRTAC